MPKKINLEILRREMNEKIRGFYPFFLGFYLLSSAVAFFSPAWSQFFYWPAFHAAAVIFTVLFLLTLKFDFRENFLMRRAPKGFKLFKAALSLAGGQMARTSAVSRYFSVACGRSAWRLLLAAGNYFVKRIRLVTRQSWIKIVVIAIVLVCALFKGLGVVDFLVLFYALTSFIFVWNSRWAGGAALVLLASCPVLLILKKEVWAENVAVYAYYFLVIVVITQIREVRKAKLPVDNSACDDCG